MRRHADRQEPLPDRGDLAGGLHRLVRSAGPREGRTGSAPSTWRSGTSRARRSPLPVHELLGGATRDYCECYATGGAVPPGTPADARLSLKERARATMEAGYRAFRMGAGDVPIGDVFDTRKAVRRIAQDCKEVREGVGPDGDWCIDFHQRFDLNDALRCCPRDRGVRALLRRRPGARRARAHGHPEAPADDQSATHPRRGVGPQVGLQPARREPRRRLHPFDAAERRRHHGAHEGRGDLRYASRSGSFRTSPARSPPPRSSTACRPSRAP